MRHDDEAYLHIQLEGALSQEEQDQLDELDAAIGQSNSVLGGEAVIDILLVVSPLLIKGLKDLLVQLSRDRRRIRIKAPGFEIADLRPEDSNEVLDRLLAHLERNAPLPTSDRRSTAVAHSEEPKRPEEPKAQRRKTSRKKKT